MRAALALLGSEPRNSFGRLAKRLIQRLSLDFSCYDCHDNEYYCCYDGRRTTTTTTTTTNYYLLRRLCDCFYCYCYNYCCFHSTLFAVRVPLRVEAVQRHCAEEGAKSRGSPLVWGRPGQKEHPLGDVRGPAFARPRRFRVCRPCCCTAAQRHGPDGRICTAPPV